MSEPLPNVALKANNKYSIVHKYDHNNQCFISSHYGPFFHTEDFGGDKIVTAAIAYHRNCFLID